MFKLDVIIKAAMAEHSLSLRKLTIYCRKCVTLLDTDTRRNTRLCFSHGIFL